MAEIEIIGIRKDNGNHSNPHEAVEAYKWINRSTGVSAITARPTVVGWLESGSNGESIYAYVNRVNPKAYCYVNTSARGTKFLQTRSDASLENNLLRLPEC